MIIETTNDALVSIGDRVVREMAGDDDELGDKVYFNDDNRARVTAEIGEYLADTRDDVEIVEDERDTDNSE